VPRRQAPDPRARIAALAALVAIAAVAAAIGPAILDLAAVGLVFVLGVALGRALPRELPRARELVRPWRLAAAGTAVMAAAGIVFLPGIGGSQEDDGRAPAPGAVQGPPPAPTASVEERRLGRPFVIDGARFRVFVPGRDPWAEGIRRQPARRDMRWVVLGVKATNLGRPRFNGNTLAYRLRADGALVAPRFSGGTGPRSLAQEGRLRRGASSLSQLGFEVPRDAVRLRLVFEPRTGGRAQVHVPLAGERRLARSFDPPP
jgi:hypothetical protein